MKRFMSVLVFSFLIFTVSLMAAAEAELPEKYMSLKDSRGKVICRTGHQVVIGDQYLNSDNQLYQVVGIQGNTARVKPVAETKGNVFDRIKLMVMGFFNPDLLGAGIKSHGPIAIYHTHSDESYVPSDGVSSKKANGGIFQVGDTLTSAFESEGIPVIHSKTPHDPHDAMAYDRSRRTAFELLKKRPSCILDVHRDAVPPQEYADVINGQQVTKVQLVVGRGNPNFSANNSFAKQIKATVDRIDPGLIKGIYYGKGKFNQDLGPRTMLLEFGAHTNSKEAAEKSSRIFAAAARTVLYGNAGGSKVEHRGSYQSVIWILAVALGVGGIFLLLNRRGLKNIGKEFTGAVGEETTEEKEAQAADQENNGEKS
jgi:stage II sporulation protein P